MMVKNEMNKKATHTSDATKLWLFARYPDCDTVDYSEQRQFGARNYTGRVILCK